MAINRLPSLPPRSSPGEGEPSGACVASAVSLFRHALQGGGRAGMERNTPGVCPDNVGEIEGVVGWDAVWGVSDFAGLSWTPPVYSEGTLIVDRSGNDCLYGSSEVNDIFDSSAGGDDWLYGYEGNDTYLLGFSAGHDRVDERYTYYSAGAFRQDGGKG